jgi:hypothetical protein
MAKIVRIKQHNGPEIGLNVDHVVDVVIRSTDPNVCRIALDTRDPKTKNIVVVDVDGTLDAVIQALNA